MRISAIIALCIILLSGCAPREQEKMIYAMDTEMSIKAYGGAAEKAIDEAEKEIYRLDFLFRRGADTSEIYNLNESGSAAVSYDTAYVIKKACEISDLTYGAFDISVAPIMDLWGFYGGNFKVPNDDELHSAAVDYRKIRVDDTNIMLDDGIQIDLGGIAKGYAGDRAAQILKENGVKSAIISLGGNVRAVGKKPNGEKWRVAVQNPDNDGYIGTLDVEDISVVTSGGYQRFFEQDGETYHHIIDPKTGYPARSGLKSVSVVSRDGALSDGLSTALFIMGLEKGTEYWRNHDGFDVIFMTDDNEIYVTEGVDFESEYEYTIIKKGL